MPCVEGAWKKGPAWVSPFHSTPVGILSCETTGSSTLSARGGPIPSVHNLSLTCFTTPPKEGERTIAKQQHVCFQYLNSSLLLSPDTALLLHIARCTLHFGAPSLTICDPPTVAVLKPSHRCAQSCMFEVADCGLPTSDSNCALLCAD